MRLKLDTEMISKISSAYTVIFLKSFTDTPSNEDYTFLNALLGFVYAAKKLMFAMQALDVITEEQALHIDNQLSIAAREDIPKGKFVNTLRKFVSEEENQL